jgi:diguanylate cyclase (GGDEF)-like protein/PAS domain S-box-containing protein
MRLPLFRFRSTAPDAVAAARALFFGEGPLARSKSPAAIVRDTGAVVVANGAAWDCSAQIGLAEAGPLRPEIAAAVSARKPAVVTLAEEGAALTLEVLPLGEGMALLLGREAGVAGALNEALVDSRSRYKALVEMSSAFVWETGSDGRFAFVSPRGALGWTADELVGRNPQYYLSDATDSPFSTRKPVDGAIVWWRRKDGGEACLSITATPIERDGRWRGARGVCRDVTAERAHEDELARARQREDLLAHFVKLLRDADGTEAMLNAACETATRAFGARACRIDRVDPDGTITGLAAYGVTHDDVGRALMITRVARAGGGIAIMDSGNGRRIACPTLHRQKVNGVLCLERAPGAPAWSDENRRLVAGLADQLGIALAQAAVQAELADASRTDSLTGLLNRRAFGHDMAARLRRRPNPANPGVLLAVDLDNFKAVNDLHGHKRGDEALKTVATLLLERTRPGDLVARLGGDEFAIWMERIDADSAAARAAELVACGAELARFSGTAEQPLGLSVGVALRRDENDLAVLMSRADAAMYAVKRRGKGGFQLEGERTPLVPIERRKAAG